MFTIPNREASTILNYFIQFKSRMENITGKNIKNIRTDQGTEYKGEFLEYLTENGIIKQTGIAYEHTFRVERIVSVRIDNFIEKCQSIYSVGGALVFD